MMKKKIIDFHQIQPKNNLLPSSKEGLKLNQILN